jgi:hypothetical protein
MIDLRPMFLQRTIAATLPSSSIAFERPDHYGAAKSEVG